MWRVLGVVVLVAFLLGCGSSRGASSEPSATTLTVLAAASLKAVLDEVVPAYQAAHPGIALTISTDSSAALATQIEQGAPADVFLSADTANPDRLDEAGLVDGAPVPFAGNDLAIIVPIANPAGIRTPADLARPGVRLVAAGSDVPISSYAERCVVRLARLPGYPKDFVSAVAANIVSREDSVRAVVAKIELGEGDAAIVYATDALTSTKVATIAVPPEANVRATYAGVVVTTTADAAEAHAFLDWLAGRDGQVILAGFGFLPPGK